MKKWMYVIFPGLGLVVFLLFYLSFSKQEAATELAHQQQVEQQQKADELKKQQAEEKAKADAQQREKEAKAEEAAKEADREKKWEDQIHGLQADIAKYSKQADAYSKQASELEIELDALHREKDQESRNDFDLLKQVEAARVHQRNAELQIQRMVEMIARRAAESTAVMQGQAATPSS